MEKIRTPFQGVWNIIRFNWHFYLLAALFIPCILLVTKNAESPYSTAGNIICTLIFITTLTSLFVSFYVYDLSGLYKLDWLDKIITETNSTIVNINAGFDETSILLKEKFPDDQLVVFDFYDPAKHSEVSIKRARKAYPPFKGTKNISTTNVPLPENSVNIISVILAAHEIRNEDERIEFFAELKRVLKHDGKIIVIEHLRDASNFLAYTIGFFHFLSKASWYKTFKKASLCVMDDKKINPFITIFILTKNGTTA